MKKYEVEVEVLYVYAIEAEDDRAAIRAAQSMEAGHTRLPRAHHCQRLCRGGRSLPRAGTCHQRTSRYVCRNKLAAQAMKAAQLLMASVGLAGAQMFHTDEEFYRYLENRQRMAFLEAQARAWAQEQELYKPIPIDEELAAEVDEALAQHTREAIQWLKMHPDR
jgi:hypothetical protein